MSKVALALLSVVALLLVVQIVDRWREPAQLKAVLDASERAAAAQERLLLELKAMREDLRRAPAGTVSASDTRTTRPVEQTEGRDGKPRLGANFLKPYDRSHFHPAWVGGTLRSFNASPKGFNPIVENSADASAASGLVNDTLCSRHPATPHLWSAALAESVVITDDWKTYTFRLRDGVMWQRPVIAGQPEFAWLDRDVPLTAGDFVAYLDMIRHPEVQAGALKNYYEDLDRAEAVDDHTLVLRWKKKVFTSMSFSLGLEPLPRHVYFSNRDGTPIPTAQVGTAFNKHWFDDLGGLVGVGAYVLERNENDRLVRFRRNPAYWGAPLHFNAIEWDAEVRMPDPQLVAFKNGQVHTHGLSPTQYKSQILDGAEPRFAKPMPGDATAGRSGELGWELVRSHAFQYIGWNLRKPMFADKRTRQALAHAFNKQRIIDEVWFGLGRPQIGPVHLDSPYFNKAIADFAFDPARARSLLADAGWSDTDGDGWLDREVEGKRVPLRVQLKYIANRPEWDATLAVYRDELKNLGVDLAMSTYEWKELLRVYEEKDFDAAVGGWSLGDLEPDFWQLWHSSTADEPRSSNHVGFRNARVDELCVLLRETFETDLRRPIIEEVQAILVEEQPYLFFRSPTSAFVWQNRGPAAKERWLQGVTDGLDAYHPLFNRTNLLWRFSQE